MEYTPQRTGCRTIHAPWCPLVSVAVSFSMSGSQSGMPAGYAYSFSYSGSASASRVTWPAPTGSVTINHFAIGRAECDPLGGLILRNPDGLGGLTATGDVTGSDVYTIPDTPPDVVPYDGEIQLTLAYSAFDHLILSATAAGETGSRAATALVPWSWSNAATQFTATVNVPFTYGDVSGTAVFNFTASA